jgi:hypothetical protein
VPEWRAQYVAQDGLKRLTRDGGLVCGVSSLDVQSKKCLPRGRTAVSVGPRYALRGCWWD